MGLMFVTFGDAIFVNRVRRDSRYAILLFSFGEKSEYVLNEKMVRQNYRRFAFGFCRSDFGGFFVGKD